MRLSDEYKMQLQIILANQNLHFSLFPRKFNCSTTKLRFQPLTSASENLLLLFPAFWFLHLHLWSSSHCHRDDIKLGDLHSEKQTGHIKLLLLSAERISTAFFFNTQPGSWVWKKILSRSLIVQRNPAEQRNSSKIFVLMRQMSTTHGRRWDLSFLSFIAEHNANVN